MAQHDRHSPLEPQHAPATWKRIAKPLGGILAGLLLVILALPMLFNTEWGKGKVREWINDAVPGTVVLGEVHFSWLGGQTAQHGELRDPQGQVVASFESFRTSISPWRLVFSRDHWGRTEVEGLRLDLVQDQDGTTNLHHALIPSTDWLTEADEGSRDPKACPHRPDRWCIRIPVTGSLALTDSRIALRGDDQDQVVFDRVEALFEAPKLSEPVSLHLTGLSQRAGLAGHFSIDCTLEGLDEEGRLQLVRAPRSLPLPEGKGSVDLKIDMENVAVDIFDQLLTFNNPKLTGVLADGLGETLTLRLDNRLSTSGLALRIFATSPNLRADLATSMRDGKLVLDRPGHVRLRVTPDFFEHIGPMQASAKKPLLHLQENTEIELILERMNVPTKLAEASVESTATLRARLRIDQADLATGEALGLIRFQGVRGVIERLEASEATLVSLDGELNLDGHLSALRVGGKVYDRGAKVTKALGDLNISLSEVPTALVDYLLGDPLKLADSIGDNADINLNVTAGEKTTQIKLQLGSDLISIPGVKLELSDRLRLVEATKLHFELTPAFLDQAFSGKAPFQLVEDTPLLLSLEELNIPLPSWLGGSSEGRWHDAVIHADLASAPFTLRDLHGTGVHISGVRSEFKGRDIEHGRFAITADVVPEEEGSELTAVFGSMAKIELEGRIENASKTPQLGQIRLSVQSDVADLRAIGRMTTDQRISLIAPASLRYKLKPETLQALGFFKPEIPKLVQKIPAEVRIETFSYDLKDQRILTSGRLTSGLMTVEDVADGHELASLRDFLLTWHYDSLTEEKALTFQGKTFRDHQEEVGHFTAQAHLKHAEAKHSGDGRQAVVQFASKAHQFPTAFVNVLTGYGEWHELLGDQVDFEIQGDYDGSPGQLLADVHSDHLAASGTFVLGKAHAAIATKDPMHISWEATPRRAEKLLKAVSLYSATPPTQWNLSESATMKVTVSDVVVPWASKEKQDSSLCAWEESQAHLAFVSDTLVLKHQELPLSTHLNDVVLNLQSEGLHQELSIDFASKSAAYNPDLAPPQMAVKAHVSHPFYNGQWLAEEDRDISIVLDAQQVALAPMLQEQLQTLEFSQHLPQLIGNRVSGQVSMQLQHEDGHLAMDLKGESGHLSFVGSVQDKILTLEKDLHLEVEITPELKQGLLKDLVPFMAEAVSAEEPLRFSVAAEGARIPLESTNLQDVEIASATLEIGKTTFQPGSQMSQVVSLLEGKKHPHAELNTWFTPLHLSLHGGIVNVSRVDALIGDLYPVALWGKVDLIKDRVRFVLGISSEALETAYGIENLHDDYMLQLPLTGTTSHAQIDLPKATARVTALVAHAQGTPEGMVFGGVLDLIGGGMDEWKVPPPTSELPWNAGREPKPKKKKTLQKKVQRNLEDNVKKGVLKLFDSLK